MKTALIIGTVLLGSVSAFAPNEEEINLARCGKGLELRGADGKKLSGVSDDGHDYTGTMSIDNSAGWDTLISTYGTGIKVACNEYNNELIKLTDAMRVRGSDAEYWTNEPGTWATHITSKLHSAGCGISKDDANIRDMVKTMTYIHQQKLRMARSEGQSEDYLEKIENHKKDWGKLRLSLKADLNNKARLLQTYLDRSSELEGENKFSAATDVLLGATASATTLVGKIKSTLARDSERFEQKAHIIKRDSLRYSVLNQIANEGERLEIFARAIERSAYDVLSTCLVNYQKESSRR